MLSYWVLDTLIDKVQWDESCSSCSLPRGSRSMLLLLCQETADVLFAHMEQRSEFLCLEYMWNSLSIKKQNKTACSEIRGMLLAMWSRCSFRDARDNLIFCWIIINSLVPLGSKSVQNTKGKHRVMLYEWSQKITLMRKSNIRKGIKLWCFALLIFA